MRQRSRRGVARATMLAAIVGAVALAGCADSPTGENHPPIPSLAVHPMTGAQCAEWSCSIDDCTNDPGQYGACCIQAVDAEHPNEQPRPSCDWPGFCVIYPNRCAPPPDCTPSPPASECFSADPPPTCYSDYCDYWS
jgi:hypothetical protein